MRWKKYFALHQLLLTCFCGGLTVAAAESLAGNSIDSASVPTEPRYKIKIEPALRDSLIDAGGTLIGDYGSYQVFEINFNSLNPEWLTNGGVEIREDYNHIALNSRRVRTSRPVFKALGKAARSFPGKRMQLVQFSGPVQPKWREGLASTGVRIVTYIPHNSYLVYGDEKDLARVQEWALSSSYVEWSETYQDADKISGPGGASSRRVSAAENDLFAIQLVLDEEENEKTLQLLNSIKLEDIKRQQVVMQYLDLVVRLSITELPKVAARADVISVQAIQPRRKLCERQDQIIAGNLIDTTPKGPGYLTWLASKGFSQKQFNESSFLVDVSDSGVDNGTTSPNHPGLREGGEPGAGSRVSYARLVGTPSPDSTLAGCDGHGTLNAHIIGGYDDRSDFPFTDSHGYHYGLGVCPYVLLGTSIIFDPGNFTFPNYNDLQSQAYQDGARISNNSWGSSSSGAYDMDAQSYDALVRDAQPSGAIYPADGNQQMVIVFAAGNDGPNLATIGSPCSAKNIITVGGAESVQSIGGTDASSVSDKDADSASDLFSYSSRGPCADGRHKPELVAPATHISGGVAQEVNPGPDGTALACYDGSGISGGVNSIFFPAGQQYFTVSSGTSHAAPCVAGACALLRQYFLNLGLSPPSPAMTKAYLVNSTRYLTGVGAADTLWSDAQGMGELDIGTAFDGIPRVLRDEATNDLFTASGQTRTFTGFICDTNKPLRVTLAWTDAPGSTTASAYNNDLDLTVVAGGKLYKGNVFNGAYSVTGGSADFKNNTESVFLPPGVAGQFMVTVTAANINSDGVPNNGELLDQDFALIVYNGTNAVMPVVVGTSSGLIFESLTPNNGAIDPLETVTVKFALRNVGTSDTTNLVARLEETGDIIAPDGPRVYGSLKAGGAPASQSFTFTANGACGQNILMTFALEDGKKSLGGVSFTMPIGKFIPATTFTENFDAVAAPNLPFGWTTSVDGGGVAWITTDTVYDSSPISVFVAEPELAGQSELISPQISINSPSAEILFRSRYNIEADVMGGSRSFDGGVLELAFGNGPFQDILAVGGTFSSGGYNRTVDPNDDNPLSSRQVWAGDSGGFVTTRVSLPSICASRSIRLKWKLGTDTGNFLGGSGWFIDTISVLDGHYECMGSGLVAPRILSSQATGGRISFLFQSVAGQSYIVQYADSPDSRVWQTLLSTRGDGTILTISDTPGRTQRYYRVKSP